MYLDGIQVYNLDNGQKLWNANYENDMQGSNGGLFNRNTRSKIYRTIAEPLFTQDAVYIVMLGTRDRTKYVEKHDLETGKLLWASEKITGAFSMPNIYKAGDKVVLQVGGKVQVQEFRLEQSSASGLSMLGGGGAIKQWVPYIYWDYKAQKNSVLCIDDKTGQTSWRSEK